eukprot:COSAG02_NODE_36124_length_458_cov_1.835655_1_plen_21_part_10
MVISIATAFTPPLIVYTHLCL